MIKAVIFDFDGVIARSMDKHIQAFKKVLSEAGVQIKDKDVYEVEGDSSQQIIKTLMNKKEIDNEVMQLTKKKRELYHDQIPNVQIEEKALLLAEKMKKNNLKTAIATGTIKENVQKILGNKLQIFDTLVTAQEVKEGKPNPQVYLKTAEKLGLNPEECIVIENAPSGITSAKKAGMTCIAITTTLNEKDLKGADYITHDFDEVRAKIEKIRETTN